jgi:hypothetical protein
MALASTTCATKDPIWLKGTFLVTTGSSLDAELEELEMLEVSLVLIEVFVVDWLEEFGELSKEGKVVPQLTTSNVNKGVMDVFFI